MLGNGHVKLLQHGLQSQTHLIMIKTAVCVLFAVAAGVQVDYAPAATSYIYRSDNAGPASLIHVGAYKPLPYAPLPLAEYAPAPLPYVAAKPIAIEDAEHDDEDEHSEEYIDGGDLDGHGFAKGGGNDFGAKHHSEHGEKGSKGYHSKDHVAKGESGHYGNEHKEGFYHEGEGGKKGHHDEVDAHGKHSASGESYKGGDHGYKQHHSKGEDITGYHKVFHKDEFKKDHDFYDVADNSGHFKKHGFENEHHGSEKGAHEKGGHHDSAADKGEFGKAGSYAKGHIDDLHKGHSAEEGADSHYNHHDDFGKKGASSHEKDYAYGDDDDYDDDDDEDDHHKA
ncbi:sarcoplasmic reticulum histidine-rich calcium-binding protein [Manduca sexta]|nr:sarcoplasmic reticulum histidine-rich calcium-binding protein [Manduca sexta]